MKTLIALPLAAPLLVAADCGGGGKGSCDSGDTFCDTAGYACDSADTACYYYSGEVYIDTASWDCDADYYWYNVTTVGWAGDADLNIYETASSNPWEEYHLLDQSDYDEDGAWDSYYIELPIVTDWEDQQSGVNTLYQCDDNMIAGMTWAITVYDYDNPDSPADCAAWGDDPSYYTSSWSYCSRVDYL